MGANNIKLLGIGFDQPELFISEYIRPGREEETSTPDLSFSLSHIAKISGIQELLNQLDSNPLCLIEGCTAPTNGIALKRFLEERRVRDPRIDAIDLMDVNALFRPYGMEIYETNFRVADARDLRELYSTGSVDVVAQDFLLNCAPHPSYDPILREAARIMNPNGLAIVCFTDNQCVLGCETIEPDQLRRRYGINVPRDAYCLRDAVRTLRLPQEDEDTLVKELTQELKGKVVVNGMDEYTLITNAGGNFEFFEPYENFQRRVEDAGMRIYGVNVSSGIDRNGITCVRYRTVLQRRE